MIACSFPHQALLVTPLLTSQFNIYLALWAASSDPSNTNPNPPLDTSPHPQPILKKKI